MHKILNQTQIARLQALLVRSVTSINYCEYDTQQWSVLNSNDPLLADLGIEVSGSCLVALSSLVSRVGKIRIVCAANDSVIFFNTRNWTGSLFAELRMAAPGAIVIFNLFERGVISLPNIFMRSPNQLLFWGRDATSVYTKIEIEGTDRYVLVGDDALFSSGVWLRNYDMHAIVDLNSFEQLNSPVNMTIEKHVWIGQEALLLACPFVGGGSIIGAKSLVKNNVARAVAVGGLPARVLKTNVSWGRSVLGISQKEIELISSLGNNE